MACRSRFWGVCLCGFVVLGDLFGGVVSWEFMVVENVK